MKLLEAKLRSVEKPSESKIAIVVAVATVNLSATVICNEAYRCGPHIFQPYIFIRLKHFQPKIYPWQHTETFLSLSNLKKNAHKHNERAEEAYRLELVQAEYRPNWIK